MSDKNMDIQKQIEKIDTKLYQLLVKRTELVKQNPYPLKIENVLGQEAMGIRRILKYHTGDFPQYVLAKIWREIFSTSANMKEKIRLAVYGDENNVSLLHCVQEHFGSHVEISFLSSFSQAFNMVSQHEADVAVVPLDNNEMNATPWWNALQTDKSKESLNIVAQLPFVRGKNIIPEDDAYVIALSPADPSGIDNSLFAIETDLNVSNSTIIETLATMGFTDAKIALSTNSGETKFVLMEIKSFVQPENLKELEVPEVFKNLRLAGTYARPIEL